MTQEDILLVVPNISEGRDRDLVARIAGAPGLLDIHSDPDHNRSVLTYGGPPDLLEGSLLRMVERAMRQLDITTHEGVHPRTGVVDVLPVVAHDAPEAAAHELADRLAERIATLGVPIHRYGPDDLPSLRRQLSTNPGHPTAGSVSVGVRGPLIAFNVNLRGSLERARRIARDIRTPGRIRALAFPLASRDLVQVSMNLVAPARTGPAEAFGAVCRKSEAEGLEVVDAEVVGLLPAGRTQGLREIPLMRPARSVEQALGELEGRV